MGMSQAFRQLMAPLCVKFLRKLAYELNFFLESLPAAVVKLLL